MTERQIPWTLEFWTLEFWTLEFWTLEIVDPGNRGPWNTTLAFLRKSPAENAHPEWSAAPNLNAIVCENHMNFGVCELILGPPAHSDKRGAFLPRQTHAKHRTTTSVQRHFSLPSTAIAGE